MFLHLQNMQAGGQLETAPHQRQRFVVRTSSLQLVWVTYA